MKNPALYLTLCGIILIASCKKEALKVTPYPSVKKTHSNYTKFSNEALKYVQLPLKAFFIYKDSITGNFDSVVVTQCNLEKKFMPAHIETFNFYGATGVTTVPDYYYETFSLTLSTYNNGAQRDWFTSSDDNSRTAIGVDSSIVLQENKKPGDNGYTTNAFKYSSGTELANDPLQYHGYTKIPALTIEGITYANVIRISDGDLTPNGIYKKTEYYWAKGIGIIKRTVTTATSTRTWTLIRKG